MRNMTVVVFAALMSLSAITVAPAAQPLSGASVFDARLAFAQASGNLQTRAFRRCMRQKYGRNFFRGVPRAHRTYMAQACGG
jgi:hypothetical protein